MASILPYHPACDVAAVPTPRLILIAALAIVLQVHGTLHPKHNASAAIQEVVCSIFRPQFSSIGNGALTQLRYMRHKWSAPTQMGY